MTREEASRILYRLERGLMTPSEKARVLDAVLVGLLRVYVNGVPPEHGPRVMLAQPMQTDRLIGNDGA